MITLILFVVIAAVLTPLLQRDCRRAVQRREFQRLTAKRDAAYVRIRLDVDTRPFADAMRKAVVSFAEFEAGARRLTEAMKKLNAEGER